MSRFGPMGMPQKESPAYRELSGTSDALRPDLPRKAKFLSEFAKRKVVGSTLKAMDIRRPLWREWMTDEVFVQEFADALEDVGDELLSLAMIEAGVVKRKRGAQKQIDKTILLAMLKNHPRMKPSAASENPGQAQIIINIKGADAGKILKVVGADKPELPEIPAEAGPLLQGPEASA